MPPEMKLFARAASRLLQNAATEAGIAPPPVALPAENFFASSRLICSSELSFWVALTSALIELLSGAFFNFEKSEAVGEPGRSE